MANIDLDPTKSSMFTGKGFAWGPTEYGVGDKPVAPGERNINDFTAFDRSPQIKQAAENMYGQQGIRQAQAAARGSKLGVGRSSSTVGQQEGIAAGTEDAINQMRYQAALDSFKEQLAQKQFAEQMDVDRYKTAMDQYKSDREIAAAEKSKRQGLLGSLGMFLS